MPYLLNLVYLLLFVAYLPWLLYASLVKGKYRTGWGAKLLGLVPRRQGDEFCVWFHAVSVGEVNLLQPLLERLQQEHPHWAIVISTTTNSGYELARRKYAPRAVFFCPLDFTWATKIAFRRVRPNLLILAELEIWPNLIRTADKFETPVAIINGRLSDSSFRGYRRLRWLLRSTWNRLAVIAAQNEEYAERFRAVGAPTAIVHRSGSLKFDGAETDRNNQRTRALAELAGFSSEQTVFLAGSTQRGEEAAAIDVFRSLRTKYENLRLILVPRHPERFAEVADLLDASGVAWKRRTELSANQAEFDVLLVDAVGELAAWWGMAEIAFVGGSWGKRGGQNMIEPAAYGAAVSFGPHTANFRDVVGLLLEQHAAIVVADESELLQFASKCLSDRAWGAELGRRAQQVVRSHRGATERTVELLRSLGSVDSGDNGKVG